MHFTPAAKNRPGYNQEAGRSLPRSGLLEQVHAPELPIWAKFEVNVASDNPVMVRRCTTINQSEWH